jgi:hypothetical protein
LATKQRTFSFTFHWPPNKEPSPFPSIGHQVLDLFSPSLFFFLKGRLGSLELSSSLGHNFQFNLENICFRKLFQEEKND